MRPNFFRGSIVGKWVAGDPKISSTWEHDLRYEDGAKQLAAAVRTHLDAPNTETLRAALDAWEIL